MHLNQPVTILGKLVNVINRLSDSNGGGKASVQVSQFFKVLDFGGKDVFCVLAEAEQFNSS